MESFVALSLDDDVFNELYYSAQHVLFIAQSSYTMITIDK